MLTIHGTIASVCIQRVIVSFLQIGLVEGKNFQLVEDANFASLRSPEWLEKQPFAQMPYVVDEETGLVLFESRAVARYAAAKYAANSPLCPTPSSGLDAYAKFEIGSSVESANYEPYVRTLSTELFSKKLQGIAPDQAKVREAETMLRARLEGYERMLAKQDWIGGDQLTLVDLWHIPFGAMILPHGGGKSLTDGSLPKVAAWWKRLNELKAWKEVNARSDAFYASYKAASK